EEPLPAPRPLLGAPHHTRDHHGDHVRHTVRLPGLYHIQGNLHGWRAAAMPELPEVESARAVIERNGLRRRIVDVDDTDTYVCRPHVPGEVRHALLGGELVDAMRQGKSMWCRTGDSPGEPTLGIHLGMSGKIVIADADGTEVDGGD